ncbi:hypothetical protein LIER_13258 [Lithospermum erythrorhizon]|uniref:Uncharacterized protein n=1 Tax=Lithospermum erythrorhizon TaxID=34254 RepID=A0AAV3PY18_LITER
MNELIYIERKAPLCRGSVVRQVEHQVDVPEWLSGMTRNHVGFARAGSNPAVHDFLLTADDAVRHQLDALKFNDKPHEDYGIEVMYRFAGFDPFERSTYFGRFFDFISLNSLHRIGGSWNRYWLTESLLHDGDTTE